MISFLTNWEEFTDPYAIDIKEELSDIVSKDYFSIFYPIVLITCPLIFLLTWPLNSEPFDLNT